MERWRLSKRGLESRAQMGGEQEAIKEDLAKAKEGFSLLLSPAVGCWVPALLSCEAIADGIIQEKCTDTHSSFLLG